MDVAVYGASGFIGKNYLLSSSNYCIPVDKYSLTSTAKEILYLIGTTDNYNVFEDPLKDVNTNIVHLIRVLDSLRTSKADFTFNYVSSWFVYGNNSLPFFEEQDCKPNGFYSISKYSAELFLKSYCQTFNIPYRIFRLGNVFGHGDGGVSKKKNALQYLIRELSLGNDINLYNGGDFFRDFIHVKDVVNAIDLLLKSGALNSTYNIASGVPTHFGNLIKKKADMLGRGGLIHSIPTPDFHSTVQVKDSVLNVDKIKKLGFEIQFPIESEIERL
jgi:nucleoside-diphosphate-sugar epimerase